MLDDKLNMKLQFREINHHEKQRRNHPETHILRACKKCSGNSTIQITLERENQKELAQSTFGLFPNPRQKKIKRFQSPFLQCLFIQCFRELSDYERSPRWLMSGFRIVVGVPYGNLKRSQVEESQHSLVQKVNTDYMGFTQSPAFSEPS